MVGGLRGGNSPIIYLSSSHHCHVPLVLGCSILPPSFPSSYIILPSHSCQCRGTILLPLIFTTAICIYLYIKGEGLNPSLVMLSSLPSIHFILFVICPLVYIVKQYQRGIM